MIVMVVWVMMVVVDVMPVTLIYTGVLSLVVLIARNGWIFTTVTIAMSIEMTSATIMLVMTTMMLVIFLMMPMRLATM